MSEERNVQVTINKRIGKEIIEMAKRHFGTLSNEKAFRGIDIVVHTYSFPTVYDFINFKGEIIAKVGEIRLLN